MDWIIKAYDDDIRRLMIDRLELFENSIRIEHIFFVGEFFSLFETV